MDITLVILAVLAAVLVIGAVSWITMVVHRARVTAAARRSLPLGERTTTAAQVLWDARELTESPHVRAIAARTVTSRDEAVLTVQETMVALPPAHREDARRQQELLLTARAARASAVQACEQARGGNSRALASGVSEGLLTGLSGKSLPGHPLIAGALESAPYDSNAIATATSQAIDRFLGKVPGLSSLGVDAKSIAGSVGSRLGSVARDLLGTFGVTPGLTAGASPEGTRLLAVMDDLGQQVSPAYLHQLVERSDEAVEHVTACLGRFEREFRPVSRGERWRRAYWPTVGDVVAQEALTVGRRALVEENENHRALVEAVRSLEAAEAKVRGTAWALVQRDVPPGAFVGPDLSPYAGRLEAYLAESGRRRPW